MEIIEKRREKTVEVDGITVTISMDQMEDIETLEALSDADNGNPLRIIPMLRRILGSDYERVKKELKGDSETLSIVRVTDWFVKATEALGEKN